VVASIPFPSLPALRAAVNRCALTRMALVPIATGLPSEAGAYTRSR
jgi:hypothetical protein